MRVSRQPNFAEPSDSQAAYQLAIETGRAVTGAEVGGSPGGEAPKSSAERRAPRAKVRPVRSEGRFHGSADGLDPLQVTATSRRRSFGAIGRNLGGHLLGQLHRIGL